MLINYITEIIIKILGIFKDKTASLFNTNTPKHTAYGRTKELSEPKKQKQSERSKINSIRNHFTLKKKEKEKNK